MTAVVADPKPAQPADGDDVIDLAKHWRNPIGLGVAALLAFFIFGLGTAGGQTTGFAISRASDFVTFETFEIPSRGLAIGAALVALLLAGVSAWNVATVRRSQWWLPVVFSIAIMLSLLAWAGAGKSTVIQVTGLLTGAVVLSVPLVFGALSGVICERSGVINIAIEGQLLFGAFLAAVLASATGNPYVGLIFAPLAGALVGALLALFAVKYWVDQIVVGVVLNVLVIGITNFFYGTLLRDNTALNQAVGLPRLPVPLLSQIPIIGPVLFNHNALVYLMYVVVIVLNLMLFKSRWGLRMRAVGEHPKAADTVGIKVNRTRVRNTILGGAVAGLGGAFFTVAAGLAFGKEMTSGKGFIALAAMILGRWSPKGALAAALFFGFAEALKDQMGIIGSSIPSQFLAMLPYLATLFAVAGLAGHVRPPAAEGKPYKK
jgi:simple sugar transport system permease protein